MCAKVLGLRGIRSARCPYPIPKLLASGTLGTFTDLEPGAFSQESGRSGHVFAKLACFGFQGVSDNTQSITGSALGRVLAANPQKLGAHSTRARQGPALLVG